MAVHQAAMRHTGPHGPGVDTQYGHFHWNSKVTYGDGKKQGGQEAT